MHFMLLQMGACTGSNRNTKASSYYKNQRDLSSKAITDTVTISALWNYLRH